MFVRPILFELCKTTTGGCKIDPPAGIGLINSKQKVPERGIFVLDSHNHNTLISKSTADTFN